jgi:MFS transporter, DHA1 family, inner membrane transport protein
MTPPRFLLLALAAIQFTNIIDFMIMMPLGKQIMNIFRIDPSQFGMVVASYTLAAWVSGMVAALYLDRFDRKKALLFTYSGFIVGTFFCAFAPTYELLVGARILTGLFGGILGAQVMAIVADFYPYEQRGKAMGIIMAAFSAGAALGVPLGIFIARHNSWQAPFIAVAIIGTGILVACMYILPSMRSHLVKPADRTALFSLYKSAFTVASQRNALLMMIVLMLGHFMVVPNVANHLQFNIGFTENELTLVYLFGGIVSFFSNPFVGKLSDRIGKEKMFTIMVLLAAIPVLLITQITDANVAVVLCITTLFFAFSGGRFSPAQALVSEAVPPHLRGSFMSFVSAMQQLGAGLGALIAGYLMWTTSDGKLEGMGTVGIIAILTGFGSLFFVNRIRTRS